jgi:hypothetical protein
MKLEGIALGEACAITPVESAAVFGHSMGVGVIFRSISLLHSVKEFVEIKHIITSASMLEVMDLSFFTQFC